MTRETNTYVHMIAMLSFSEAIAAASFAFGFPEDYNLCVVQGVMLLFFQRAKWIWSALIGFQLYRFMVHDRKGLEIWQMHTFCWSIDIILLMLPLVDGTAYGLDSEERGSITCYFAGTEQGRVIRWVFIVYFLPLVICTIIMIYIAYSLWMRFRYLDNLATQNDATTHIKRLVRTMVMYPIATLITTLPNMLVYIIEQVTPEGSIKNGYVVSVMCFSWSFSYGIILALIFFTNSQEAKRRWRSLLFGTPYVDQNGRLVRENDETRQESKDVDNISRSMNNALGIGISGNGNTMGGRSRDSFGRSSTRSTIDSFSLSSESRGSSMPINNGNGNSIRADNSISTGVSGALVKSSSPVFTSHSATYAYDDTDVDAENPMHE